MNWIKAISVVLVILLACNFWLYMNAKQLIGTYEQDLLHLLSGSLSDAHTALILAIAEENARARSRLIIAADRHGTLAAHALLSEGLNALPQQPRRGLIMQNWLSSEAISGLSTKSQEMDAYLQAYADRVQKLHLAMYKEGPAAEYVPVADLRKRVDQLVDELGLR